VPSVTRATISTPRSAGRAWSCPKSWSWVQRSSEASCIGGAPETPRPGSIRCPASSGKPSAKDQTRPASAASKIWRAPTLVSLIGLPPAVGSTSAIVAIRSAFSAPTPMPSSAWGTPTALRRSRIQARNASNDGCSPI